MGLKDLFTEKAEKVEKEKSLEVVVSKESNKDDVTASISSYFLQNLPPQGKKIRDDFNNYVKYLKNFEITPPIISHINDALPSENEVARYRLYKGLFLSALIQTSYNQGFNDFEFGEVDADCFGAYLTGKKADPIKIKADVLFEDEGHTLSGAKNCLLKDLSDLEKKTFSFTKSAERVKSHFIVSPIWLTLGLMASELLLWGVTGTTNITSTPFGVNKHIYTILINAPCMVWSTYKYSQYSLLYKRLRKRFERKGYNEKIVQQKIYRWSSRNCVRTAASETGYLEEYKRRCTKEIVKWRWWHFLP